MMFNMFTEPKLIEPEKALPGREACASRLPPNTHTYSPRAITHPRRRVTAPVVSGGQLVADHLRDTT